MSLLAALESEAETVTFTRYAAGSRTAGVVTPGAISTFDAVVSVQPMSPRQVAMLPEGIRQRSPLWVGTGTELKATDPTSGAVGDTFTWQGRSYEITGVEDWTVHGGFYECVAAKVES